MAKTDLTAQRLRELLHYDPNDGLFRWLKHSRNKTIKTGDIAGRICNGYVHIGIDGTEHKAHRVAWLYVYGVHSKSNLDHINQIKTDNRIANLRETTFTENAQNRSVMSNSKSGVKGVFWDSENKKWRAIIRHNRKSFCLGRYTNIGDAAAAYSVAAAKYHTCNPSSKQAQQAP